MKFYNTLTRKKEIFKSLKPHSVGLYSCGPTVYDYTHVGHARHYVFVDVLKKTLKYSGYDVVHVMNITDVGHLTSDADTGEDKMEKKATAEGKTAWEIAQFYTHYFWTMIDKLNIDRPDVVCKATDYIQEMIKLINKLEVKGFTYQTSDGIYFDTSKFENYGKLARLRLEDLKEGARVGANKEKRNPTDFALWKFSPAGKKRQMEWPSPWGVGFPGWHLECSAMSMAHLGPTIDIHTGGVEHIPVHHTNEIAQSEAATGKTFVRYWLHGGHLIINGQKMSKSLGNFYRLEDLEKKGFAGMALRYLFLTAHYRAKTNFTLKALEGAQKSLDKLKDKIKNYETGIKNKKHTDKIKKYQNQFEKFIADDLDTPKALALVWEVVKSDLPNNEKLKLILDWDKVLGLRLGKLKAQSSKLKADKKIQYLIKHREKLRKQQKWQEADQVRKEIEKKGYLIEDMVEGTKIVKI